MPDRGAPIHASRRPALFRRTVRVLAALLVGASAVVMVGSAVAVIGFRVGLRPVLSPSMEPAFAPGALLVTRQISAAQVRPGDVIVFRPPNQSAEYAHRVTAVSGPSERPVIATKGDANPVADPWTAELASDSVPVVVTSVPWVGRLVAGAQAAGLRVALVVFAGLVILIVGTRSILGPAPASPRGVHAVHARV